MSTEEEIRTPPAVDKSGWMPGPWMSEPDFERFEVLGFPAIIRRVPGAGHLCGYLAVPPGHPWHGKSYSDENWGSKTGEYGPSVHGGITYAEACEGDVCHIPKAGEPANVWWVGFDCSHAFDMRPGDVAMIPSDLRRQRLALMRSANPRHQDTYRTVEYVKAQLAELATQAIEAAK